jgi:hypothetical protein
MGRAPGHARPPQQACGVEVVKEAGGFYHKSGHREPKAKLDAILGGGI